MVGIGICLHTAAIDWGLGGNDGAVSNEWDQQAKSQHESQQSGKSMFHA
jgi:hypothetical protein